MKQHRRSTIDAEALQRELCAMKRDILDAEPVSALNRIDSLLDELLQISALHSRGQPYTSPTAR